MSDVFFPTISFIFPHICQISHLKWAQHWVNFSCWTYWFLLVVYFSYLGFGAWMFVKLEQPTEQDRCDFVNEFTALYANAGEEYAWAK